MDPRHPLYTPELSDQYGKTIENLYVRMDAVLGQAAERIGDDGTLIVLSDHGFQPFYRVFSQNSWLLENGYARLIDPRQRDLHTLFANTDWEHTYAYGLGINSLYLNLRGREKCGVVSPGRQADTLIRDIAGKLQAEKDPKTGQPVFSHVYRGSDIYRGQCASQAPDLVLGYNHGYRASWKTILGAYETDVIADNRDCWSGDHCMDVEGLSGVLLSNKRIAADHPALTDLSPTILAEFGLDPTEGSEGKVVLEQTS
jgi:predicted AlkP superfamily phosphohydrolase/phosphomutase